MFVCCVCDLLRGVAWLISVCVVVCLCGRVLLDVFVYFVCDSLCDVAWVVFVCDSLCDDVWRAFVFVFALVCLCGCVRVFKV